MLQFPRLYDAASETDALSRPSVLPSSASAEFYDKIKTAIDAVLTEAYVAQVLSGSALPESPFDAVFISALVPDSLDREDLHRMARFSHVKDLSDSIDFEDHWDD